MTFAETIISLRKPTAAGFGFTVSAATKDAGFYMAIFHNLLFIQDLSLLFFTPLIMTLVFYLILS